MTQKAATPTSLLASAFGNFTRDRLVHILKSDITQKLDARIVMAASGLASLDPHGQNPGGELIKTALDTLQSSAIPLAGDLLWQAAEHAANNHIRIEAIKRCGGTATTPARRELLRKWASEGFNPGANFQNEQFGIESARVAALNAMAELETAEAPDIDILIAALTPPTDEKFFQKAFLAAAAAYHKIGTPESFANIVAVLKTKNWRIDIGLTLLSLGAKFTAAQLKPHADLLREQLFNYGNQWQDEATRTGRLVALAEKLATPEFLQRWSSGYGSDGLSHNRGKITKALIQKLGTGSEGVTKALLILAQHPGNVAPDDIVMSGIKEGITKGHGNLVAKTITSQTNSGYDRVLASGDVFGLFLSMEEAVAAFVGAVAGGRDANEQRRFAPKVAIGLLTAAASTTGADTQLEHELLARRRRGQWGHPEVARFGKGVAALRTLPPDQNPVVLVSRHLTTPATAGGASAIVDYWLHPDDDLTRMTLEAVVREIGRAGVESATPETARIEQFILKPDNPFQPLRQPLEKALLDEVLVAGRVNRYAIDLMHRENLGFERGATAAFHGLQVTDDADFLLNRLSQKGENAFGVLSGAVNFHRDGNEALTEHVQAKAIDAATGLLNGGAGKRTDQFAKQLHLRFHDPAVVREGAYRAAGRLGSFVSIKPLRDRLAKEPVAALKSVITESLNHLRDRLATSKPAQGAAVEAIEAWLRYVADLGDPALLPQVTGFLRPPHADHGVRRAALLALESMRDAGALAVVKYFMENTAPEGETLAVARRARLLLEDRKDVDLFDVLGMFFPPESEVLDPALMYDQIMTIPVMAAITRGLRKAQKLWEDGHWDEFVTQINAAMEALIRQVFRTRFAAMGIDQPLGEKLAGGNAYANMLNLSQFKLTYVKLQAHANTIQSFRRDSPTAHAMNKDGSAKVETTDDEANYVRDEFLPAFTEVVNILK